MSRLTLPAGAEASIAQRLGALFGRQYVAITNSGGEIDIRRVRGHGIPTARSFEQVPHTEMLLLPGGRVSGAPIYVTGWKPVTPTTRLLYEATS